MNGYSIYIRSSEKERKRETKEGVQYAFYFAK